MGPMARMILLDRRSMGRSVAGQCWTGPSPTIASSGYVRCMGGYATEALSAIVEVASKCAFVVFMRFVMPTLRGPSVCWRSVGSYLDERVDGEFQSLDNGCRAPGVRYVRPYAVTSETAVAPHKDKPSWIRVAAVKSARRRLYVQLKRDPEVISGP